MSIKRIIFVFIMVVVAFAVCIGFWMTQTDVVLSPESVDIANGRNDDSDSGDVIVGGDNKNTTDASSYIETIPDASGAGSDAKDAKDLPLR